MPVMRGSFSDGQLDDFRCTPGEFSAHDGQLYGRTGSSSNELFGPHGGAFRSDSDLSDDDDGRYHSSATYANHFSKGAGKGAGRQQSYMPPCRIERSLTDSLLERGRCLTSPPATLLSLDGRSLRQTASLPAVLQVPERDREPGNERRLRLSQARLIIPRTVSEYFDCCRYSRSHSEGLLFAASQQSGVFMGCQDMVGKAWSEGLLGGRLIPGIAEESGRSPEGTPTPAAPPRPIPVEELKEGAVMEGQIVQLHHMGFFVEVGATKPGLLRRRHCQDCPRRLLQNGQVLSNLVVLSVDTKKTRFSLALHSIDGSHVQEEAYDLVLARIAGWAGVSASEPKPGEPGTETPAEAGQASGSHENGHRGRRARGRGRGRGTTHEEVGKSGKGKHWRRRGKNFTDAPSAKPSTTASGKGTKGHGKGRGKGYSTGGISNNAWSRGARWSQW